MTQYQQPPYQQNPYGPADIVQPRKTSGLAITSLVLSIIGLIPCIGICTAPFGILLGLIAAVTTGGAKKGRGLAIAAILIGVIGCAVQFVGWQWFKNTFIVPVMEGPKVAMTAGFNGDLQAFRDATTSPATDASDEEITLFFETLRARYGEFQSVRFDEQAQQGQQPQYGQPVVTFPYVFEFSNATVKGETEIIFADQTTGKWIIKPSMITITDPDLGDLVFPPGATSSSSSSITITPSTPDDEVDGEEVMDGEMMDEEIVDEETTDETDSGGE